METQTGVVGTLQRNSGGASSVGGGGAGGQDMFDFRQHQRTIKEQQLKEQVCISRS